MKILIVMGGFFPGKKYGGPPVSVDNFCSFMEDFDCYIVTHNCDMGETIPYEDILTGWNDRGNCKVKYLSNHDYSKSQFENVINEIKPNIIYLQGLFQECVIPCLQLAKKYNIKIILAPRGELCAGALSIKKYKKLSYIYILRIVGLVQEIHFHSTSDEETESIHKYLKIPYNRIHLLTNIFSFPSKEYPHKEKVVGNAKFVFLSRIHPKKNLLSAIQYFENVTGNVLFDIYGSLEDENYWKKCQESIDKLPSNIKVQYRGLVDHNKVHQIFSEYDAFLFPTLSENFGHVIAEALIVGCPVIISDQTPWNGVNEVGAGWAISLNSKNEFKNAIEAIISSDNNEQIIRQSQAILYVKNSLRLDRLKTEYLHTFVPIK